MRKNGNKLYVTLIMALLMLLTACQAPSSEVQASPVITEQVSESEVQKEGSNVVESFEIVQDLEKESIEPNETEEQPSEEIAVTNLEFLNNAFIIEVSKDYKGNQKILALKDDILQLWINQNIACEMKIPVPVKLSVRKGFYSIIGNPYISEDGSLVMDIKTLMQYLLD